MVVADSNRVVLRAAGCSGVALGLEWTRALAERNSTFSVAFLAAGGAALCALGLWFSPRDLGISRARLPLKLAGGLALAVLLLLPGLVRGLSPAQLPLTWAGAAVLVSVGEEVAFRGAVYAALKQAWGVPAAVLGSSLLFTAGHVLSHPVAFLVPVLAAGVLLSLWRWVCDDLIAPIIGHTLADLAL